MRRGMLVALAVLGGSAWLAADEVILQNGNVIIGKATYLDDGKLKVAVSAPSRYREHTAREVEMTFAGSEVKQIRHSSSLFSQANPLESSEKQLALDEEKPLPALEPEPSAEKTKKPAPAAKKPQAAAGEEAAETKPAPVAKPAPAAKTAGAARIQLQAQLKEKLEKLLAEVEKDPIVADAKAAVKEMEANLAAKKAEHEKAHGEAAQRLAGEVDDLRRALEDTKRNYQGRVEARAATLPEIGRLRKRLADMEAVESGATPPAK